MKPTTPAFRDTDHSSSFPTKSCAPDATGRSLVTMTPPVDSARDSQRPTQQVLSRRQFVGTGALAALTLAFGPSFWRTAMAAPAVPGESPYGPLNAPDANGFMLPAGFRSREVARAGVPVAGYEWHNRPDGGATFATGDGGWILVSNSETISEQDGGASAIEFGPDGSIKRAYRILGDTDVNCSGGHTPWGTYLSCEEWEGGQVWECDPSGKAPAVARPAMGTFTHEAACVDPVNKRVYMTEDEDDGRFYRFTPSNYPDLSSGVLEIAIVGADNAVHWQAVPDPSGVSAPTRDQVAGTRFAGGEGTWFDSGIVYFTTKGDNKVHAYDTRSNRYELIYDEALHPDSPLSGLDGITVSRSGDLYLCEDGGDLDICMITPERVVSRFLKLTGADHDGSELCGVVFDPSGERLYFSSMGSYAEGATYEVTGPFRGSGPSAAPLVIGATPPAQEEPAEEPAKDAAVRLRARRRIGLRKLLRRGITVQVAATQPGTVSLALRSGDVLTRQPRGNTEPRPRQLLLARRTRSLTTPDTVNVRLRLSRRARRRLRRASRASRVRITAQLTTKDGTIDVATRRVRLRRS
jgi:secreted PhoX family phosphatase